MNNNTRKALSNWIVQLGKAYGVSPTVIEQAKQFAATPQVEQILKKAIVEKSTLLKRINVRQVSQISGKKLGMLTTQPIASNTDTSGSGVRTPVNVFGMSEDEYKCEKTNYDTAITYENLDEWSEFKNFKQLLQDAINETIANNKAMIAWYGEAYAKDSDLVSNPLMQDVGIGWFQQVRNNKPSQLLTEGGTTNEIRFGTGGDYENIDHAVEEIKTGIPAHKRNDPSLVVLVGSDLLAQQRIDLYKNQGGTPSEKERVETPQVTSTFGNLPLAQEVFFPGRGLAITSMKNLSIYTQKGSVRRSIVDNASKDQIENYLSMRDAFVVEDYDSFAALEFKNVKLPDGAGGWA